MFSSFRDLRGGGSPSPLDASKLSKRADAIHRFKTIGSTLHSLWQLDANFLYEQIYQNDYLLAKYLLLHPPPSIFHPNPSC